MPTPKFLDTHCHVQFAAYKEDAANVIDEALKSGTWMIAVGTQSTTSSNAVALAEKYPEGVFAAIGLHPNHLFKMAFDEDELHVQTREERFDPTAYASLAENSKVVGVGECGIDLYHMPEGVAPEEVLRVQEEEFRKQIDFASEHDLPLIVHCRDAHDALTRIVADSIANGTLKRRGVIHSFTGTWAEAERYVALGFMIGFNGIITFPPRKSAPEIQERLLEAVRNVPADMFVLETDAPYLSPIPKRGERNRPDHIVHVAEKMAELRGVTVEEIAKQSVRNTLKLFFPNHP